MATSVVDMAQIVTGALVAAGDDHEFVPVSTDPVGPSLLGTVQVRGTGCIPGRAYKCVRRDGTTFYGVSDKDGNVIMQILP